MSEISIRELKKLYVSLTPKDGEECVYCGMLATDKEHVLPRAYLDQMRLSQLSGSKLNLPNEIIVPACRECNLIAGPKVFDSFSKKKKFIREELRKKYKKFVKFKIWTPEEINELKGRLKERVFMHNEVAKVIQYRHNRLGIE